MTTGRFSSATAGIILAGGQSLRMGGRDKALIPLGGKVLLQRVLERLRPQTGCVAINANGDPLRFNMFGAPVFADGPDPSEGPAFGIRAALDWAAARGNVAWIVTAPTDTPFIPLDLVERLIAGAQAANAVAAIAASGEDKHPTIAAWSLSVRDQVRALLGRDGLRAVHAIGEALGAIVVPFAGSAHAPDPFFNINSPIDLKTAELSLAAR